MRDERTRAGVSPLSGDAGFAASKSKLSQAARSVAETRDLLISLEASVYAEAARTLAEAIGTLERVVADLRSALPHEWLTHEEAAAYLRESPDALHKLARSEDVPRHRISRQRWRYSRTELDEWLLER